MTATERKPNCNSTTHTPYLTLMGELWDINCKDLGGILQFLILGYLYTMYSFYGIFQSLG